MKVREEFNVYNADGEVCVSSDNEIRHFDDVDELIEHIRLLIG
jgi:hypothetical protein